MKRFVAMILALVCLLVMAGCDTDPTTESGSNTGNNNSSQTQGGVTSGGVTPGGDGVLNEDGTLNIPSPEAGTTTNITGDTWTSLLSEDAIRVAMKDNSITTLTSSDDAEQYQMFFCAGGRYGSILHGNLHSETICCVEGEKVYVFTRSAAEGSWEREVSKQSYDEYVSNHYTSGAMQFLSGISSVFSKAQYVESEKAYVIENHVITHPSGENLTGTLKVQFANEKLYSISLTMTVEGQTATLRTLFGSVATPEIPTDYNEGSSGNISVSPEHNDSHIEPPEASCNEQRWQQLFGDRIIDNLMDNHITVKISNGQQEYLYQMDMSFSRFVISANGGYEEILISHGEYFQRDSKDGQWLHYMNHRDHKAFLNEKTAVLTQLFAPIKGLYKQTSFDGASRCFSLTDVSFTHDTFGSVTAEYAITIQGGMIEQIKATIESDGGTWTLFAEREKGNKIDPPTDYVDVDNGRPGTKK